MLDWRVESYTYDPKGNRLTSGVTLEETEARAYTYYANSDRLKTDGNYGYTYDANGNLTGKATGYTVLADGSLVLDEAGDEYWQYEWDLLNRLIAVSKNGTLVAGYRYDADGLRVRRTDADSATYWAYDTAGRIAYEERASAGYYIEYVYGGSNLLARVQSNVTGDGSERETQFYLTDHVGSTVMVTDSSGGMLWQEDVTPFGTAAGQTGLIQLDVRFTGKDIDTATALYYSNARWFDGDTGRFISEDPIRHDSNWYQYAYGNPLRFTDPSGEVPWLAIPIVALTLYLTSSVLPDPPEGILDDVPARELLTQFGGRFGSPYSRTGPLAMQAGRPPVFPMTQTKSYHSPYLRPIEALPVGMDDSMLPLLADSVANSTGGGWGQVTMTTYPDRGATVVTGWTDHGHGIRGVGLAVLVTVAAGR